MAQPVIQTGFSSGELAPDLYARVDLAKYHSGAALLRNFYVDYRGGASTRPGTKYILRAYRDQPGLNVRLIPFRISFATNYILEFGQNYIRFYQNGSPILESALNATGATNLGVITINNSYNPSDWVFANGFVGITNINGKYFYLRATTSTLVSLGDLILNNVYNLTGTYTSGGTLQRVYTLSTPYNSADIPLLKFKQVNATTMIIVHPNYAPQALTIVSANNWSLTTIAFGSSIRPPTGFGVSGAGAGSYSYGYTITALDANNQESGPATPSITATSYGLMTTSSAVVMGAVWAASPGASSYNIYKASPTLSNAVPSGSPYGFIANCTGTSFYDSSPGIAPDFAQTPPVVQNPFLGSGVASYTVTAAGVYTTVPTATVAVPSSGAQATAQVVLGAIGIAIGTTFSTFTVGDVVIGPANSVLKVTAVNGFGVPTAVSIISPGSITSGSTPTNPQTYADTSGNSFQANVTWGVVGLNGISSGSGYTLAPVVTFSSGIAAATAVLGSASAGNPSAVGLYQERLVLAAPPGALQTLYLSQPGSYYNFNTSNPIEADDAITQSIVSGELNQIQWLIQTAAGLIVFTSASSWLVNGGSAGAAITPSDFAANPQVFGGASQQVQPIVTSSLGDILYVQAKDSFVRDLSYNFYANVFTGTDISVQSSHLFYGLTVNYWAWAEEPFKTVWAVRSDGTLLSLAFMKEQEVAGWAHHDTQGFFESVASVTESVAFGFVDAVYTVVTRAVQGISVQYVERMAERYFGFGAEDAWCVDAGLQTAPVTVPNTTLAYTSLGGIGNNVVFVSGANVFSNSMVGDIIRCGGGLATIISYTSPTQVNCNITKAFPTIPNTGPPTIPALIPAGAWSIWVPVTSVSGLDHLNGSSVVGLGDGNPIGPFTVSNGSVNLGGTYSKVTIGLSYTCQLQTLALDLGEPTVQGKRKKITAVTVRCKDTLGLQIGSSFSNLVPMKDLVIGNVGTQSNTIVSDLVTGDARTIVDPLWQVPGQYCIQQSSPLPATVLGVIPEITVGDTPK